MPLSALFRRGMIGRTLTAALTAIAVNVAVYGFVAWLPTFFVHEGRDVVTSLGFTTLMSLGAPFGAVLGYLTADRLGRAKGLVLYSLVTIVLGFVYPQMTANIAIAAVGFTLVSCIFGIVTLGLFGYVPVRPDAAPYTFDAAPGAAVNARHDCASARTAATRR